MRSSPYSDYNPLNSGTALNSTMEEDESTMEMKGSVDKSGPSTASKAYDNSPSTSANSNDDDYYNGYFIINTATEDDDFPAPTTTSDESPLITDYEYSPSTNLSNDDDDYDSSIITAARDDDYFPASTTTSDESPLITDYNYSHITDTDDDYFYPSKDEHYSLITTTTNNDDSSDTSLADSYSSYDDYQPDYDYYTNTNNDDYYTTTTSTDYITMTNDYYITTNIDTYHDYYTTNTSDYYTTSNTSDDYSTNTTDYTIDVHTTNISDYTSDDYTTNTSNEYIFDYHTTNTTDYTTDDYTTNTSSDYNTSDDYEYTNVDDTITDDAPAPSNIDIILAATYPDPSPLDYDYSETDYTSQNNEKDFIHSHDYTRNYREAVADVDYSGNDEITRKQSTDDGPSYATGFLYYASHILNPFVLPLAIFIAVLMLVPLGLCCYHHCGRSKRVHLFQAKVLATTQSEECICGFADCSLENHPYLFNHKYGLAKGDYITDDIIPQVQAQDVRVKKWETIDNLSNCKVAASQDSDSEYEAKVDFEDESDDTDYEIVI